jgi:hypothetical protein
MDTDGNKPFETEGRGIKKDGPAEDAIQKNRNNLPYMKPVSNLTGDEFGADIISVGKDEVVRRVGAAFSARKYVHNKELGDIQLSKNNIREDNDHGNGPLKRMAYGAVIDILENGAVIDFSKKHKGRKYDTAVVAAPIIIKGNTHFAAAVVRRFDIESEKNANQRFYLHKVYAEEKASTLFKSVTGIISKAIDRANVDAYNNKITHSNTKVNT